MSALAQLLGIGPTNVDAWVAGIVVIQLAFLIGLAVAGKRTSAVTRRWNRLLIGSEGKGVLDLLEEHLQAVRRLEERVLLVEARLDGLETRLARSVRRMGLVKYDAFDDVGGEQSFALALCDDEGNGTLLTGLLGRSECRVFAKPLAEGRASVALTKEEQSAMEAARRWD